MPSNPGSGSSNEASEVAKFLRLVSEMFRRPDFLLPLAAGQRQFRDDNYNMASAALLEDLFYDAFGMYLRENYPTLAWLRRDGKELWDYQFGELKISHKETLKGSVAIWWTAGDKKNGKWVPRSGYATYSSPHPIVVVVANAGRSKWESSDPAITAKGRGQKSFVRKGKLLGTLGGLAIAGSRDRAMNHALVLAECDKIGSLVIENVWAPGQWEVKDFHDLWPQLGGPGLNRRDLWVDYAYKNRQSGLSSVAAAAQGARLTLTDQFLTPGIYVVLSSEIQNVPLVANNRAHFIDVVAAKALLDGARNSGRYVPFPMWFAHFAVSAPPNLYGQQRAQYEELFAARRRVQP